MKKSSKLVSTAAAVLATVCAVSAVCACTPEKHQDRRIEGSYTIAYDNEYVTTHPVVGSMYHTIGETTGDNTVEFKKDGSYKYSKHLTSATFSLDITFAYTGTYSDGTKENSYVLGKPTACEWSITPGMTAMQGWGDGVGHSFDQTDPDSYAAFQTFAKKEYKGGLNDAVYFAVDDETRAIDYFLSGTLSFNDTADLTDDKIFVEIEIDEGAGDSGNTFTYLVENRVKE